MRHDQALAFSLLLLCAGGGIAAQCAPSNGHSTLSAALARTGVDPDASGSVTSGLSALVSIFQLEVGGLAPSASYAIAVDDRVQANFVTDDKGGARVLLRTSDDSYPVGLDARGREVEVRGSGGADVLRVALAAGMSGTTRREERVLLAPTALAGSGRAEAKLRATADGRRRFSVEVENVPGGTYQLFVGATLRGSIAAPAGLGEIEFDSVLDDTPHGELLLDFNPEDAQIDLVRSGELVFTGSLRATVPSVDSCAPSLVLRTLPGSAGEAKARFRVRDDCDRDFEVEIEDVAAGAYTLLVGGVARGTINAAFDATRGRVRGEIEFDTDEDEAHELPLTFDPLGQSIQVVSGAQVAFSLASFVAGPGASGTCTDDETRQDLHASSAQPAASGGVRLRVRDDCRTDFKVEIEDVVAGVYEIAIGGAVRGTVTAAFDAAAGQVRGEVEFGDDSPGSPALDFDPSGEVIEIVQNGVVVLSTGIGAGPGSGVACVDASTGVALLNLGVDADGHAEARLRVRGDCRETFHVEVEDVPAGVYSVLVDGVAEATITVGALGRGEVELDTDDAPKPLLDFDPRGREIAIAQGATIFFAHTFPQ